MIDYREIIRLKNLNHSNAHMAVSVGSSRNTVADVYHRGKEHEIGWPIPDKLTNKELQIILLLK